MVIRIVLADDHSIFRDGLKLLLRNQQEVEVVGEANDGVELLQLVRTLQPDIAVTDIKMPGMDGVEACRMIRRDSPNTQVIALSMFDDDHLVVDMLEAGAKGYLLKNTNRTEMLEACHAVCEGESFYAGATSKKLARLIANAELDTFKRHVLPSFSSRELEIIQMIAEQLTNKEIASRLNLSVRTVESHREKIQEKTDARNMVGVVIYAIRHGLIKI